MDVTSVSASVRQHQTAPSSSEQPVLNSDFETFLKMLTAQMQNQDPLNPIESTEFASQLAAFSSVEQQVRTNDLLIDLGQRISGLDMAQMSGWIGMQASAVMPLEFAGSPVTLTVEIADQADKAELVLQNEAGEVVLRQELPVGSTTIEWAGVTEDGPLASGTYIATVDSLTGEDVIATTPVEVHGVVAEARRVGTDTLLIMQSGQEVFAGNILGLRNAEGM